MLRCAYCKKQIYTDSYYAIHLWKGLLPSSVVTLHWECAIKLLNKYNTSVLSIDILRNEGVI